MQHQREALAAWLLQRVAHERLEELGARADRLVAIHVQAQAAGLLLLQRVQQHRAREPLARPESRALVVQAAQAPLQQLQGQPRGPVHMLLLLLCWC